MLILGKIERMTQFILQELSIQQLPVCVDTIATRLALQVIDNYFESSDISGMLYLDNATATCVIGVNSAHGEHRRRFTIAHPISHFLLHPTQEIHYNHGPFMLNHKDKDYMSTFLVVREQKEVNAFATNLLMPGLFMDQTMQQIDPRGLTVSEESMAELQELSEIFKVTPQALGIRMGRLGYI